MKNSIKLALILVVGLLGFPILAGASESFDDVDKRIREKQLSVIGRIYYLYMDRSDCRYPLTHIYLLATPSIVGKRFTAREPIKFVVDAMVKANDNSFQDFYRVRLDNEILQYINVSDFGKIAMRDYYRDSNPEKYFREGCVFDISPEDMDAKMEELDEKAAQKKAAAEEAGRKFDAEVNATIASYDASQAAKEAYINGLRKRPPPRIGMSTKQVIEKSNCGKPDDINRTTTQHGISEQWVYGYRSYLYFKNGKLVAIQE